MQVTSGQLDVNWCGIWSQDQAAGIQVDGGTQIADYNDQAILTAVINAQLIVADHDPVAIGNCGSPLALTVDPDTIPAVQILDDQMAALVNESGVPLADRGVGRQADWMVQFAADQPGPVTVQDQGLLSRVGRIHRKDVVRCQRPTQADHISGSQLMSMVNLLAIDEHTVG